MKSPTKLHPTDLIAVEVPSDATQVQVWNHGIGFKAKSIERLPDDTNGFFHLHTGLGRWSGFETLGEATEDEISFDVELHIEKMYFDVEGRKIAYFKDYNPLKKLLNDIYCFTDKNQSFQSLLKASELNWVNPIEKPNKEDYIFEEHPELVGNPKEYDNESYEVDLNKWQEAESKLIKGKLIILKIIK